MVIVLTNISRPRLRYAKKHLRASSKRENSETIQRWRQTNTYTGNAWVKQLTTVPHSLPHQGATVDDLQWLLPANELDAISQATIYVSHMWLPAEKNDRKSTL